MLLTPFHVAKAIAACRIANQALIILGHNRSEEIGMKHLTTWLEPLLPGVPIAFAEAGEPFDYL